LIWWSMICKRKCSVWSTRMMCASRSCARSKPTSITRSLYSNFILRSTLCQNLIISVPSAWSSRVSRSCFTSAR
jgi:hypothetical protein